jgi:hypothetical protein
MRGKYAWREEGTSLRQCSATQGITCSASCYEELYIHTLWSEKGHVLNCYTYENCLSRCVPLHFHSNCTSTILLLLIYLLCITSIAGTIRAANFLIRRFSWLGAKYFVHGLYVVEPKCSWQPSELPSPFSFHLTASDLLVWNLIEVNMRITVFWDVSPRSPKSTLKTPSAASPKRCL